MTDTASRALLPQGLRDILPPDADHEADAVSRIMSCFARHGYRRVKPPLIEFEATLLDGAGAATSAHCFRVMDPVSQVMMGVRADMTPQVARIAVTRLAGTPRPLRLSYAGDVLRLKGNQLNPDRQSCQAGLEVIGSSSLEADAEVLVLAVKALQGLNVPEISVDLSLPTLVPLVLKDFDLSDTATNQVYDALYHKDAALLREVGGAAAPILLALMEAAGSLDRALDAIQTLNLRNGALAVWHDLLAVVALIKARSPGLALTLDPVENRGFTYHTGIAFTIFSRRGGGELGRGGRYLAGGDEPATGATLFLDGVLSVAPPPVRGNVLYVAHGDMAAQTDALQSEGWIIVQGLEPVADAAVEAKRLKCGFVLSAAGPVPVAPN